MTYETLELTRDGAALRVVLNRPGVLNALSEELLGDLRSVLEGEAADESVRAVLITGAGRGFCAGADLGSTEVGAGIGEILEERYNPVVRALATLGKPVVAGVNGVAAGAGLSLALACDLRLVSSAASFTVGFTGIGLVMDASCSYFLPRLVGRGRALELAYSGRRVGAEEAVALGLGEVLLPAEGFAEAAWEYVRKLAAGPTLSFALVKEQVNASAVNDLEGQLALEAALQQRAAESRDVREGIAAFSEKRRPAFEGR